jgi:hypothetical protein
MTHDGYYGDTGREPEGPEPWGLLVLVAVMVALATIVGLLLLGAK